MIHLSAPDMCIGKVSDGTAAGLGAATERYLRRWLNGPGTERDAALVSRVREATERGAQSLSAACAEREWRWDRPDAPLGVWLVVTRPLAQGAGPEE